MELSDEVNEGLSVAGDSALLPDEEYMTLLDNVFQALTEDISQKGGKPIKNDGQQDGYSKLAFYALSTFIVEAIKFDSSQSQISSILEDDKFSEERSKIFLEKYKRHEKSLRLALTRIGEHPPHIVDVNWRLDYTLKNNLVEKVNEPRFQISLQTENGKNNESGKVQEFSCNQEQLQDLVGKLKDACKSLEKAGHLS